MASEVFDFAPTIPAGTLITAPVTVALTMPVRIVQRIEIRVPPGPCGVMGFALAAAGQPMIPVNAGAWVITDDEQLGWDLTGLIESGAWQLMGYNAGNFDHTVYVRFLTQLPGAVTPAQAPTVQIPNTSLDSITATDLAALAAATLPPPDLGSEPAIPDVGAFTAGVTQ